MGSPIILTRTGGGLNSCLHDPVGSVCGRIYDYTHLKLLFPVLFFACVAILPRNSVVPLSVGQELDCFQDFSAVGAQSNHPVLLGKSD